MALVTERAKQINCFIVMVIRGTIGGGFYLLLPKKENSV